MTSATTKRQIGAAADRLKILRIQRRYGLATLADVRRAERELADLRKPGEAR